MLKRAAFLSLIVALALAGGWFTSTTSTRAQDDMGGMVTCDSTLVTLLFIAENDYGFHSMLDVASLEKGEYAPLFDEMMAQMDDMGGDEMMGEDMMGEDEDMMGDEMMTLSPGVVPGEDQFCTDLRAELETFFYDYYTAMSDEAMDG